MKNIEFRKKLKEYPDDWEIVQEKPTLYDDEGDPINDGDSRIYILDLIFKSNDYHGLIYIAHKYDDDYYEPEELINKLRSID